MFKQEEFMVKFDLKSGYHHVDVHPRFLIFQWEMKGATSYAFVFAALPIGVSTACYLLTKLLRLLISKAFETAD